MRDEFLPLWALVDVANQKYIKRLHILGDSKLVVDCVYDRVDIVAHHLDHIFAGYQTSLKQVGLVLLQ